MIFSQCKTRSSFQSRDLFCCLCHQPPHMLIWSSGIFHAELYGLPLPTFSLSLVVTSHLVLEVFARQLLLSGIVLVFPLTSVLAKLSQHPPTPEISSFPLSLCHCLVTYLSASDSFSTMALYKSIYLLKSVCFRQLTTTVSSR